MSWSYEETELNYSGDDGYEMEDIWIGDVNSDGYNDIVAFEQVLRFSQREQLQSYYILSMVQSSTKNRGLQLDNVRGIAVPKGRCR